MKLDNSSVAFPAVWLAKIAFDVLEALRFVYTTMPQYRILDGASWDRVASRLRFASPAHASAAYSVLANFRFYTED